MNHVQRDCTGTDLSIPDGITPIRGIRVFGLDNKGRLSAARFRHFYNPNENVATCHRRNPPFIDTDVGYRDHSDSQTPHPTCTCGFYGFWDLGAYFGQGWRKSVDWPGMYNVVGLIEGYGRVLLGTKGFRAQKARVVAINVKDIGDKGSVTRMKKLYPDIPVFENTVKKIGRKKYKTKVGSGTDLMVAEFPLYEPGDEGDSIWEWDRE